MIHCFESFKARVTRANLPNYTNYFCGSLSEREPFGTFLWHDAQVLGSTLISEAINNIKSQIVNSIPSLGLRSWLGVGTSRKDQHSAKICAAEARESQLACRTQIGDAGRRCERSYPAPFGFPLLAVADSCARVLLIHVCV